MNGPVAAIDVEDLTKVYASPEVRANDGISFSAFPGEAFGLLGPNGAGKSTLVKQLVGLLEPTGGEIRLFGERLSRSSAARAARSVAYLPQQALSLSELRVGEAIRWTGMLRGLTKDAAAAGTAELIADLALGDVVERQMRKLSGGQRRLVHIGMTLIGGLPVLILDEPTADIDPALRQRIWSLIGRRVDEGAAVLLVTHDVAEAEHVLDRVAIIDAGRIAAMGTPAELKADLSHRVRLEVVLADEDPAVVEPAGVDMGVGVHRSGRRLTAWVAPDEAVRRLDKLMASSIADSLEDVRLVSPSLEDVYLEVVGHAMEEGE